MATIQKRKNKNGTFSYRVMIRPNDGLPPTSKTFPTFQEAKDWSVKEEADRRQGVYFPEKARKKHTFGELVERYRESVVPFKLKNPSDTLRYLNHWKERLGLYSLNQITADLIDKHRKELIDTPVVGGKKRSPATTNRYMATLSAVLTYAVNECEWISINPVSKLKKLKESRGRDRILSQEEVNRLLDACAKSKSPYLLPFVTIAISTGARKMEILSLTYSCVDLKTGFVELRETKNGKSRSICLVGIALNLIRELHQKRKPNNPYIFPSEKRFGSISIRKAWENALIQADLTDLHIHDLRHQFCTTAAKGGASSIELMAALGHSSAQMTARYSHLTGTHTKHLSEHVSAALLEGKTKRNAIM